MNSPLDERVLLLSSEAPELCPMLEGAGIRAECFRTCAELLAGIVEGAGALILAEHWLDYRELQPVLAWLEAQPEWSELPVFILCSGGGASVPAETLQRLGNVTLLDTLLPVPTLVSAVRSALRSRRRQYQVRAHLREREAAEQALRDSAALLRLSLDAGRLGFWRHDVWTDEVTLSDRAKAHFGRAPEEPFTHADLLAAVHPEDRPRVQETITRAVRARQPYSLEYRVFWPDGSLHWVMVRGEARYSPDDRPLETHGVTLDITERKEAEVRQAEQAERLRGLSESLQESARRKDEFLAVLAHELRNPLSPVAHALEILRSNPTPAKDAWARQVLDRQLRHMTRLIEDLLDVSRLNNGKITLKRQRMDLAAAVASAVESVRQVVEASSHTLEVSLPRDQVWVDADPVRVEQIVTNLLTNAAKYTERGGWIRVALGTEQASAHLRIADSGIGIAPELLGRVFELFTQGDRGTEHSQGGLGLGLSLVRSLVQLHGGAVEAYSDGPGRGSEFVVTFPLAAGESEKGPLPEPELPAVPPRANGRRLLVVDDNRDAALALAELAETWGLEVQVTYDGVTALERVGEWDPAFVCLDIGMPGLSGYEVARRLRADSTRAEVVLIALTGYGQEEDRRRSREAGFNHHLVKPVDPAVLKRLLCA